MTGSKIMTADFFYGGLYTNIMDNAAYGGSCGPKEKWEEMR